MLFIDWEIPPPVWEFPREEIAVLPLCSRLLEGLFHDSKKVIDKIEPCYLWHVTIGPQLSHVGVSMMEQAKFNKAI